ncbi:MAG: hypothetical protein QMC90_04355 [Dehalococcoidales bacterium]|nr:hypothetical protein [Dehalococcoidales bacterium]
MAIRETATCYSCGKRVEYTPCSERGALPDDARCSVLNSWLTVSQWKGMGRVDQYDFCSFDCLQRWVEARALGIPKTFLKAFQGE